MIPRPRRFTREPASRMHRPILRLASASTSRLTAAAHGRTSPRIRASPRGRSIAMPCLAPDLEHSARGRRLHTPGPAFNGRSISSIVVDGSTPYVGSTRGVRGVSSVSSGGVVTLAPGLPPYGLWKSTDGGANFTLLEAETVCLNPTLAGSAGIIQSSFGSTRGVNHVALDPSTSTTVYAAAFPQNNAVQLNTKGGVWRSTDSGANWTQIKTALNPGQNTDRAEFAVTKLGTGNTRMYVGDGNVGSPAARFYRSDNVATGTPLFIDLTTTQNINYCTGQCWY